MVPNRLALDGSLYISFTKATNYSIFEMKFKHDNIVLY